MKNNSHKKIISASERPISEKLAHFDREVIPKRRLHAKESSAFGTFTVTNDISDFTKAKLFSDKGKKTDVFVRFSTVASKRDSANAERDIRGFAIKFFTEEGNWDLVGNNTPVFFLKDPYKFPDLNKLTKRNPKANLGNANHNWDFWTLLPETLHQVTITMSERGIPKSYRHMNGYGGHTFSFINNKNERYWVKFHLKTNQGIQNLTDKEAEDIIGEDRDSHQHDLFNAIEKKEYPKWHLKIQLMPDENASCYRFDPFDLTKVWPHRDYPLIDVGILELNKNSENYFASVEQTAFNPANVVPGIGFSPDRMLQDRLFSSVDAQRYRLGENHYQTPVNKPDSYGELVEDKNHSELGFEVDTTAFHYNYREDNDYYSQPGALFRMMSPKQKRILLKNTARHIINAEKSTQMRHIHNCYKADPNYGKGLAKILNISLKELGIKEPKSALSY